MISVIVVSYNVKEYLANCLSSLLNSDLREEMQIIVVDNCSFDGSVAAIRERFPDVQVIENGRNMGFARGVNAGIKEARGKHILVLNPDTIVQEDTLIVLSRYLDDHHEVGICGPKILNADGTLQLSCKRSFPTPGVALPKVLGLSALFPRTRWMGRYNLTYLDADKTHSVEAISGSCMFIRREVIDDIGLFDERFFMFGEDLDFCFRAIQSGWEIHYVPETQIVHYKGESVKVAPFDSLKWFYEAMNLFVDKHFSKTASLVTRWSLRVGIFFRKSSSLISSSMAQFIPALLDVTTVIVGFLIGIPLRFGSLEPLLHAYLPVIAVYAVLWLIVGSLFQLYSRFVLSYNRAMLSSMLGFLLSVAFTYFFKQFAFSRFVLLTASLAITVMIPGWRLLAHVLKSRGFFRNLQIGRSPIFSRRAVVVGAGREGKRIAKNISRRLDTGIYIVGFCDDDFNAYAAASEEASPRTKEYSPPFLGTLGSLPNVVRTHTVRELIFSSDRLTNEEILRVMDSTKGLGLTYRIVPKDRDILLGKASVEDVSDFPFVSVEYTLYRRLNMVSKRSFDLIMSVVMLIVLSPVLVMLKLRFPRWRRMTFWGIDGSQFGAFLTPARSRFLRELPLLLSILSGKMSFVGSSLIPVSRESVQLMCKPGLTGLDRIRKLNVDSKERSVYEHYYVQHQSLVFDMEILVRTIFAL